MKPKASSLEKSIKIDKPVGRLIRKRREKQYHIRNEKDNHYKFHRH